MTGTPPDAALRVAAPEYYGLSVKDGAGWGVVLHAGRYAVVRSDPRTWEVTALIPLDAAPGIEGYGDHVTFALGEGNVWVGVDDNSWFAKAENRYRIYKISMASNQVLDTIRLNSERHYRHLGISVTEDAVWGVNGDRRVFRIDANNSEVTVIPLEHGATDIRVGSGYVWAKQLTDDIVSIIEPRTAKVTVVRLGYEFGLWNLSFDEDSCWITSYEGDIIAQLDPRTAQVQRKINLPNRITIDGDTYERDVIFNQTLVGKNSLWLMLWNASVFRSSVILAQYDLQRNQITSKVELGKYKPISQSQWGDIVVFVTEDQGWWNLQKVNLATGSVERKLRVSYGNLIPRPFDLNDNVAWFTVPGHGIYRATLDQ